MVKRTSITATQTARAAKLKEQAERLARENRALRKSLHDVRCRLREERAKARTVSRVLNPHLLPAYEPNSTLRDEARDAGLIFLRSELQLARTSLAIALHASDSHKRRRNVQNARTAYDALLRFYRKKLVTKQTAREFDNGIAQVRKALQEFGESV